MKLRPGGAGVATALAIVVGIVGAQAPPRAPVIVQGETVQISYGATEADWAILDTHPNVKEIVLPSPPNTPPVWTITTREFAHVANCTNLERLFIGQRRYVFSDDALRSLAELKKLRILELFGPLVSDAGIANLAGLNSLEELRLDGNDRIGDQALASLKDLTNLRKLYFYRVRITDAGVARIGRLTSLETLMLGDSQVGDAAMATIAHFAKLQELDLQHTHVTEAGLRGLSAFPELEWLNINGLPATDSLIPTLLGLKKLRTIEMNGTRITVAGEARLKAAGIARVNR